MNLVELRVNSELLGTFFGGSIPAQFQVFYIGHLSGPVEANKSSRAY